VKLETEFTHCNQLAIEASYLYSYCICLLLKGGISPREAYEKTLEES
jgi:ADP-ribosylglycohydrolase